jgi:hypothetical protein
MDSELPSKINIEELFETEQKTEIQRKNIYLKILNRVHKKITTTSRTKNNSKYCFFIIPEIMLGIPSYDLEDCKQFIFSSLIDNGFQIKYTHPNLLFISWSHILPSYMRKKIKKETGYIVNSNGEIQNKKTITELTSIPGPERKVEKKETEKTNSTDDYKPTGIYNLDFLNK